MSGFEQPAELDPCSRLLLRIQQGDEQAFRQLYADFGSTLLLSLLRILPDQANAERALHAVFLDVWLQARTFDPDLSRGGAWLLQRARRHLDVCTRGQAAPLASAD